MRNSKTDNLDITNAKRPKTKDIIARDEYGEVREFPITGELPLTIFVNKKEIVTLMTLGNYPESLVIGYLRNQGFIAELNELLSVHVDWDTNTAAVKTASDIESWENKLTHKIVTSGCGQGTTFGGVWDELKNKKLKSNKLKQSTIYQLIN